MNEILYDLTYWFDYSTRMVLDYPLLSVTAVVGAVICHQAIGAMKLIVSVITFVVAALTALLLGWFLL